MPNDFEQKYLRVSFLKKIQVHCCYFEIRRLINGSNWVKHLTHTLPRAKSFLEIQTVPAGHLGKRGNNRTHRS